MPLSLHSEVSLNPDGPQPGESVATPGSDGPRVPSNAARLDAAYRTHRAATSNAELLLQDIRAHAAQAVRSVSSTAKELVPMLISIGVALTARARGVSGLSNVAIATQLVEAGLIEKVGRGGILKSDANRYIALARWSELGLCNTTVSNKFPVSEFEAATVLMKYGVEHDNDVYTSPIAMLEAGVAKSAVYDIWSDALRVTKLQMQGLDPSEATPTTPLLDRVTASVLKLSPAERKTFIASLTARFDG